MRTRPHRRAPRLCLIAALAGALTGCQSSPPPRPTEAPPVANKTPPPRRDLPTVRYGKWRDCYLLTNDVITVAIVPAIGRIMQIGSDVTTNFLRNDRALNGKRLRRDATWVNYGGDWIWPLAQGQWTNMVPAGWPPPAAVGEGAWDASAWQNLDGSQSCLMLRRYGDPVNLVVSRMVTVDASGPHVRLLQRALCVQDCAYPITLWNISQIGGAERVFFPVDPSLAKGYRAMMFDNPAPSQIATSGGVIVFTPTANGQFKLGTGSTNVWIAAQRGDAAIFEQSLTTAEGKLPDDSSVEVYSNGGLGYSEIETLTPQVLLQPGDTLENTITIECLQVDPRATAAEVAAKLKELAAP